jgi:16S rRNA (adenine1518-N6/adenine1519-N6)-dimethyltransferase
VSTTSPKHYGERAKKRFGQHFLHDANIIAKIVAAIDPQAADSMVEIGPGPGALTVPLLARLNHLHVVEIDRDVIAHLKATQPESKITIHASDVLEFDFSALPKPLRVVGNLPYNISSPILFRMHDMAEHIKDCVFMLQKEVVDRMVAGPDTADYGRLSVMLQYRFAMSRVLKVPPGAFRPPPKVDSAIVRMVPLPTERPRARDDGLFARVVAAGFNQRRKTLANALKTATGIDVAATFARAGIDGQRRAETLAVGEFIAIADAAGKN